MSSIEKSEIESLCHIKKGLDKLIDGDCEPRATVFDMLSHWMNATKGHARSDYWWAYEYARKGRFSSARSIINRMSRDLEGAGK